MTTHQALILSLHPIENPTVRPHPTPFLPYLTNHIQSIKREQVRSDENKGSQPLVINHPECGVPCQHINSRSEKERRLVKMNVLYLTGEGVRVVTVKMVQKQEQTRSQKTLPHCLQGHQINLASCSFLPRAPLHSEGQFYSGYRKLFSACLSCLIMLPCHDGLKWPFLLLILLWLFSPSRFLTAIDLFIPIVECHQYQNF